MILTTLTASQFHCNFINSVSFAKCLDLQKSTCTFGNLVPEITYDFLNLQNLCLTMAIYLHAKCKSIVITNAYAILNLTPFYPDSPLMQVLSVLLINESNQYQQLLQYKNSQPISVTFLLLHLFIYLTIKFSTSV